MLDPAGPAIFKYEKQNNYQNLKPCRADPNASLAYIRDTIKVLGVKQLDLVLIHSPCANYDPPVPNAQEADNVRALLGR
jgi:diketogulonate reductase-like aldo/keto reductase